MPGQGSTPDGVAEQLVRPLHCPPSATVMFAGGHEPPGPEHRVLRARPKDAAVTLMTRPPGQDSTSGCSPSHMMPVGAGDWAGGGRGLAHTAGRAQMLRPAAGPCSLGTRQGARSWMRGSASGECSATMDRQERAWRAARLVGARQQRATLSMHTATHYAPTQSAADLAPLVSVVNLGGQAVQFTRGVV
jgi:hypothetical protein